MLPACRAVRWHFFSAISLSFSRKAASINRWSASLASSIIFSTFDLLYMTSTIYETFWPGVIRAILLDRSPSTNLFFFGLFLPYFTSNSESGSLLLNNACLNSPSQGPITSPRLETDSFLILTWNRSLMVNPRQGIPWSRISAEIERADSLWRMLLKGCLTAFEAGRNLLWHR